MNCRGMAEAGIQLLDHDRQIQSSDRVERWLGDNNSSNAGNMPDARVQSFSAVGSVASSNSRSDLGFGGPDDGSADLLCPFQILDCEEAFCRIRRFKAHVIAHFRSHALPKRANCFLCDQIFTQKEHDDVSRAWNEMLSHLALDHYYRGQRLSTVRTDFALMRWMYTRRLLSDTQMNKLQLLPKRRSWIEDNLKFGIGRHLIYIDFEFLCRSRHQTVVR